VANGFDCWLRSRLAAAAQAIGPRDQQGPVPVTVSIVQEADVADKAEFVGRIEAIEHVDVRARVEGFLQSLNFREGDDVKRGDLLYVIEPDQYQAAGRPGQGTGRKRTRSIVQCRAHTAAPPGALQESECEPGRPR